ncbi:ATP-dependent DNA helicase RecQ [Acaryochloris thomasi RCC1774]|uniref:DNA 3'-5' helicase n=1 Tax=Acaryochloris thomasi RCC1774 TaxID=1764569 RepID=A0A2W1JNL8_9CYAN|nr:RecQ family ATP-dependent DNA helicase [Acaryochloris thomasi]PZD71744.1 ATP-dependent DNA helicase RecQ [Acaryochloris thomasi RCC1774]
MLDSQPLDLESARYALKQFWGYDQFRPPQEDVVSCLLAGQDALVLLPTGAGKSICFQLPALLRPGLTLVVSPLVSLMENQVQELRQRQIKAALLHSQLSPQLRSQTLDQLRRLDLLYLSPESLLSSTLWPRLCSLNIGYLIIDEAHCISQWGVSFRPVYRRLGTVRSILQQGQDPIPVAAFTATATPTVQQEIQTVLQLQRPRTFRVSPYRANLNLRVQVTCSSAHRRRQVLKLIQRQGQSSGLIYTRSRRDSEALVDWLRRQRVRSVAYHAGLPPERRRQIEADWLTATMPVVVCTSAFGMGINKPDCRWICHFHAPLSVAAYVQEIGRAGRDGLRSQTLLLVSEPTGWLDPQDQQQQRYFAQQRRLQQQQAQRLVTQLPAQGTLTALQKSMPQAEMVLSMLHSTGQLRWIDPFRYVMTANAAPRPQKTDRSTMKSFIRTRHCRWRWILGYFGFASATFRCGHCDRCRTRAG